MPQAEPIRGKLQIHVGTDVEPKRTILLIGPPKTGKTHFLTTCPHPLIIQWDRNSATLDKFDVPYIIPGTEKYSPIKHYELEIIPAIQNRRLAEMTGLDNIETICEDSLTFKGRALKDELTQQGRVDMGFEGWGQYLNKFDFWTKVLTGVAHPQTGAEDRPCYNYVATVHESAAMDPEGRIARITPSLEGQFKDLCLQYFDSVFSTDSTVAKSIEGEGKDREVQRRVTYFFYTVPPDKFRRAGDGVGGGKYKVLPEKVPNTYPELAKAWGLTS